MEEYLNIVKHYEACFSSHGDSSQGVDWPNQRDAEVRYQVMLDIAKLQRKDRKHCRLLDFGCGTARMLDYLLEREYEGIEYAGLDISGKFVAFCRKKYPNYSFIEADILKEEDYSRVPTVDYCIMNGVFTEKQGLEFNEMWDYVKAVLKRVFKKVNKGVAFNVMSKNVDWERDDLFHLSKDMLTKFMCSELSRNFIIRNDYGLYEYTTYIYK
jgi:SAM-dependent methyltransferase